MKHVALAPLLLLALSLLACGGGADPDAAPATGASLYQVNACYACHGRGGEGSSMGPSLLDLEQHWTRDQLVEYLLEPQAFVQRDERLRAQRSRYPQRMASFKHLTEEERGLVADHVLGL
jgi:mono/diheme cytochrome c family protein